MRYLRILLILGMFVALLAGCSDKQKEAEKLEEEMKALESDGSEAVEGEIVEEGAVAEEPVSDVAAIPEEETLQAEPLPTAPEGSGYTVQIASCEDSGYARHLIGVYSKRGYEPFVTEVEVDGQQFYRVRIGTFGTLGEAAQLKSELSDRYSLDPWIDLL